MPKKIIEDLASLESLVAKPLNLPKVNLEEKDEETPDESPVISNIPDDTEDEEEPKTIQKSKKPRSDKQIAAFAKIIELRNQRRNERALIRETEQAKAKEELKEKIMKKAVSIKKKQIKQQIALDDISSDDEPIESIKKKVVASKAKQINVTKEPVKEIPKYIFV